MVAEVGIKLTATDSGKIANGEIDGTAEDGAAVALDHIVVPAGNRRIIAVVGDDIWLDFAIKEHRRSAAANGNAGQAGLDVIAVVSADNIGGVRGGLITHGLLSVDFH